MEGRGEGGWGGYSSSPYLTSRSAGYLSEKTFQNKCQTEWMLPPQMKWPRGLMYMWVHAARSCEWEVGTEWEEKSCFSETISAGARWKAVTLPRLGFVRRTCSNVARPAMLGKGLLCVPAFVWENCTNHYVLINLSTQAALNWLLITLTTLRLTFPCTFLIFFCPPLR